MIHASLCTGIGACELAATWMDWENAFSCEINEFCQRVLKYYYPKSKHYENIFGTDFAEWRGKIDVLTAGFPCQPFSCAGARKGAEDDRYLWPEVLRVIREIQPTWFIGENVAGITSMVLPGDEIKVGSYKDVFGESYQETEMRQQFVVERICRDLERIGYSIQPVIIPACAIEAPHKRDRIWFIAYRSNTGIEDVQQERKNRILPIKSTPYTDGKRCNNRSDYWKERQFCLDKERYSKKNKSERNKWKYWTGKNGAIATNAKCFGSDKVYNQVQSKQSNWECINSESVKWIASDSAGKQGERMQFEQCKARKQKQEQFRGNYCEGGMRNWAEFPTQSPVCCGNDGLSSRLFGITFSKHREESIKAFGNTMVPQVVYQIFKAIEESELLIY